MPVWVVVTGYRGYSMCLLGGHCWGYSGVGGSFKSILLLIDWLVEISGGSACWMGNCRCGGIMCGLVGWLVQITQGDVFFLFLLYQKFQSL